MKPSLSAEAALASAPDDEQERRWRLLLLDEAVAESRRPLVKVIGCDGGALPRKRPAAGLGPAVSGGHRGGGVPPELEHGWKSSALDGSGLLCDRDVWVRVTDER
jgi:hypothetical protein